jgi:hypothetical protein
MKVHYSVQNSPSLDPIICQKNRIHTLNPYSFSIHFNIILPSSSRSLKIFTSLHSLNSASQLFRLGAGNFLLLELFYTVRGCEPLTYLQAGGSPLVSCPRLLIQYIPIYPPYAGAGAAQSVQCLTTGWKTGVRSPAEDFSSSFYVQTGSGAHPASCTMGTGGKARLGRDADHSPSSSAEIKTE